MSMSADQSRMTISFLIQDRLFEFGRAVDSKQFHRLDAVFDQNAVGIYNGANSHETAAQLIAAMHHNLGVNSHCGVSQHNILNVQVVQDDDVAAESRAYFYAIHAGVAAYDGQLWKTWGEYNDFWILTAAGWRIRERRYTTFFSEGPAEIVTAKPT